ncbi:MAG: hypothetical protein Q9182_003245 [Xanthomendoza sp. 2 TL-2023]
MVYKGKDKPSLEITLTDGQQNAFVPQYTTLDEIKGFVTITPHVETKIDQILVTFEGFVRTYVEKVGTASATSGRTEGFREIFRLTQPISEGTTSASGKMEAGKPLTVPFEFAVPIEALPKYCEHPVENEAVHRAHLQLPPTLGDPLTAVWGKSMKDDMAPDMTIVSYSVRARLASGYDDKNKRWMWIADLSRKVRVVPAVPEHPPLAVLDGKQDDYRLRKEKSIKKGTFQKKFGTLVMESAQPPSLHLPPLRTENPGPVTTMAKIKLRFEPASPEDQPPKLSSLVIKLKVATFFATKPMGDIPKRSSDFHYSSDRGLYVESLPLSSRCVEAVAWAKHTPPRTPPYQELAEHSIIESSIPAPSEFYKEGQDYYTARILAPITLPVTVEGNTNHKVFLPTFHTCLLARVYALDLHLTCRTPSASITMPEMHLKLPIQVSAAPSPDARPNISEGEAQAIARREAAESHPGNVAPPSPAYTEHDQSPGAIPSSPSHVNTPPMSRSPGPSTVYPGPVEFRRSAEYFETPRGLPPPDYNIQTSGRPNARTP